ncbi:MAG: hypothetical protein IJ636_00225 [Bacteroidales bacterium]|nr:hypothetical protein [Bacteroidales bacterium]
MRKSLRYSLILLSVSVLALGGCGLIDEERVDCPEELSLTCALDLITNKEEEMDLKLGTDKDLPVRQALEDYLKGIFVDEAHDVDLSFYDLRKHGERTAHQQDVMNAGQKVYEVRLPSSDYQHLGLANLLGNGPVVLEGDEVAEESQLRVDATVGATVESHRTGIFSARKRMLVRREEEQEQHFDAHLYMANDAAALVLNVDSCRFKSIRAEYIGLADTFRVSDSTYTWERDIRVKADRIDVEPFMPRTSTAGPTITWSWGYDGYWTLWERTPVLLCGVGFPSRNVGSAVIGTNPLIWTIDLYVELQDGTTTLSQIYIGETLPASYLRIIKGWIFADGSFSSRPAVPLNPEPGPGPDPGPNPPTPPTPPGWVDVVIGVDVMLNWQEGLHFDPVL